MTHSTLNYGVCQPQYNNNICLTHRIWPQHITMLAKKVQTDELYQHDNERIEFHCKNMHEAASLGAHHGFLAVTPLKNAR